MAISTLFFFPSEFRPFFPKKNPLYKLWPAPLFSLAKWLRTLSLLMSRHKNLPIHRPLVICLGLVHDKFASCFSYFMIGKAYGQGHYWNQAEVYYYHSTMCVRALILVMPLSLSLLLRTLSKICNVFWMSFTNWNFFLSLLETNYVFDWAMTNLTINNKIRNFLSFPSHWPLFFFLNSLFLLAFSDPKSLRCLISRLSFKEKLWNFIICFFCFFVFFFLG